MGATSRQLALDMHTLARRRAAAIEAWQVIQQSLDLIARSQADLILLDHLLAPGPAASDSAQPENARND